MPDLPRLSIVTPTFNSIHTVRETIESVMAQQVPGLEHIVMDGGSTDGTVELLKSYPHLIWESAKDRGHYDAMNKGVRRATGEVVNILNSDDCFRPGALRAVGEAFAAHPEWDGLFGDIVYVDGEGREIFRREEAKFDYNVLRYSRISYVIHQTVFVRRSLHDRLGYYRDDRFHNACDYDFMMRMGREKCRIGHIPALLVNYRYHNFGQSADLRVTRNMLREADAIRAEHGVPGGLAGDALRVIYRAKRQLQKLFLRGHVDLVPGTRILRRHMREKTEFTSNFPVDKL